MGHIHTGKGEHKGVLRLVAPPDTAPVDEQLDRGNRVACHHIHRLMVRVAGVPDAGALPIGAVKALFFIAIVGSGGGGVVPVADDLDGGGLALHNAEAVKALLFDPAGIDAAAHAGVFAVGLAAMLGRVRPAERRTGAVVVLAGGTAHPIVEKLGVAARVFKREIFTGQIVEVVPNSFFAALADPAVAVVEIRRGEVVPDAAGGLLAAVLGLGDGAVLRQKAGGVAVQHRADILALVDDLLGVQGAAAHKTPAVGVQPLLEQPHLPHVLAGDRVVAGLPEQNGRVVAEGDDDIAHQLYALVPLAAEALLLLVTGRLGADDAAAVKRTDIGGAARHMHKADVVGVALADEGGVLIVQPLGRNADGRPLVGGALGVAAQPLHRAVDAQAPVLVVAYGAEADRQLLGIGLFAVYKQLGLHGVEVGVIDAPEAQWQGVGSGVQHSDRHGIRSGRRGQAFVLHRAVMPGHSLIGDIGVRRGDAQRWDGAARGGCSGRGAVKDGGNAAVRAAQRDAQLGGNGDLVLVADLGLDPNIRRGVVQIKIPAVDIEALGLQIGVERQRQIDIGLEKHLHGAGDAADRGIEVVAVPEKGDAHAVGGDGLLLRKEIAAGDSIGLVGGLGNAERRIAGGGVVGRNGDEVRRIVPHIGGDVKAERRNAGLIVAGQRAVYIEVAGLAQPLKRKQYLVVFVPRRNGEDVAIEGCRAALAAAAVLNAVTEQILIIEGVGQRDGLPAGFPVVGLIKGVPLSVPVGVNGLCHGEGICPQKVPAVVEIKAFALQCRHSVFSLSDVLYTVAGPRSYLYHTRCRGEKQVSFDGQKVLKARCSDKYQDMEIGYVCRQQGGVTQSRRESGAVRARPCGKASAVREAAAGLKTPFVKMHKTGRHHV